MIQIAVTHGKNLGVDIIVISKNDITGDKIQTKGVYTKEAEDRFDKIFRKPKPVSCRLEDLAATIEAIRKLDKDAL